MKENGAGPTPRRGLRVRRPVALAVGAVAALLIAGVLVAPIVILGGGSGGKPCAQTLRYQGRTYVARPVAGGVQDLAVGVGVVSGCGTAAGNVNLRTLAGVPAGSAVTVSGDATSVYVRRGICGAATKANLLACLKAA